MREMWLEGWRFPIYDFWHVCLDALYGLTRSIWRFSRRVYGHGRSIYRWNTAADLKIQWKDRSNERRRGEREGRERDEDRPWGELVRVASSFILIIEIIYIRNCHALISWKQKMWEVFQYTEKNNLSLSLLVFLWLQLSYIVCMNVYLLQSKQLPYKAWLL